MTGTLHEPGDDAGQRAFHPGDHDDDARSLETGLFRQQAMEAGDADVVQPVDRVAHQLGGDGRLFGDREVRRSGARDQHRAVAARGSRLARA